MVIACPNRQTSRKRWEPTSDRDGEPWVAPCSSQLLAQSLAEHDFFRALKRLFVTLILDFTSVTLTTPLPRSTGAPRPPQPKCKGGVSDRDSPGVPSLNSSVASRGVRDLLTKGSSALTGCQVEPHLVVSQRQAGGSVLWHVFGPGPLPDPVTASSTRGPRKR